jgi:hypothetical protein
MNKVVINYIVCHVIIVITFGVPVEPDVYMTIAVSSGVGDAVVASPVASTGVAESMLAPCKELMCNYQKSKN